jgi:hypothetical protein
VTDSGAYLSQFLFWQSLGFGQTYSDSKTFKQSSTDSIAISSRVGLEAGIGYKIPISSNIYLVPQLRYQLMLTKVEMDTYFYVYPLTDPTNQLIFERTENKVIHSLQLALALWFDI